MFEGQRDAAIREHEAGLTLIRDTFRDVPAAIDIDPHYSDQLWVKDCRFENISGPAVIISNEKSPLTEIGFENAVLKNVPIFALFRDSGKKVAGKGPVYRVRNFNYGLILPGEGMTGTIGMLYDAAPSAPCPPRCHPRSRRCHRPKIGSTCTPSASPETARPTTPPPSRRPSTAIACSIFRAAITSSAIHSR